VVPHQFYKIVEHGLQNASSHDAHARGVLATGAAVQSGGSTHLLPRDGSAATFVGGLGVAWMELSHEVGHEAARYIFLVVIQDVPHYRHERLHRNLWEGTGDGVSGVSVEIQGQV
jgi:hypothetical protein